MVSSFLAKYYFQNLPGISGRDLTYLCVIVLSSPGVVTKDLKSYWFNCLKSSVFKVMYLIISLAFYRLFLVKGCTKISQQWHYQHLDWIVHSCIVL